MPIAAARGSVRRLLGFLTALALALGLATTLLLAAPAARAQSVPRLSGQITDQAGVLGSDRSGLQSALDDLQSRANVQLWVLTVSTTGSQTAPQYATQTFTENGLGGNDLLLVVAVKDQRYGWAQNGAVALSNQELTSLASANLDSHFKAGDYAGGIASFASALRDRLTGAGPTKPVGPPPAETITPVTPGQTQGGGGDLGGVLLVFAIVIIVVGVVVVLSVLGTRYRRWRLARTTAEERDRRTGALAKQSNSLLLQADDAIRDAQQEIGFAEAEFSAEDVAPFKTAIADAQDKLKQAFALRAKLDDAIPEDPVTREQMYTQLVGLSQAALATVDEQHKSVQALRDLERNAPQALAALPDAIAALQARLPAVQKAQATLQQYATSSWAGVRGNPEEADKRGDAAEKELERGKAAVAATPPDNLTAVHAVRAAQGALAEANQLLDAFEKQAEAAATADAKLEAELQAASADVDDAVAAMPKLPPDPARSDALARARQQLADAKAAATAQPRDPIAALKATQDAHAAADKVLEGIREAEQARLRASAALGAARGAAKVSVESAGAYIASRRNGIGPSARARLTEAERHLAQSDALVDTDIAGATREAQLARQQADEAYAIARDEFEGYDQGGPRMGGGGGGGGNDFGTFLGGVILGGILSGGGGGGRHHGGWGGTPWGSGGGWGGGGGGGGGGFGGFGGGGGGGISSGGGGWGGGGGGGGGVQSGGGGW